ncbi:hypothetical protein CC2G_001906 [Coprinopsis cinerea AmutBmut pab1-1]|nr:hypothetical protein CC2G_001906 [Coprinopsis cinerea AmutBmut pab1-1]
MDGGGLYARFEQRRGRQRYYAARLAFLALNCTPVGRVLTTKYAATLRVQKVAMSPVSWLFGRPAWCLCYIPSYPNPYTLNARVTSNAVQVLNDVMVVNGLVLRNEYAEEALSCRCIKTTDSQPVE